MRKGVVVQIILGIIIIVAILNKLNLSEVVYALKETSLSYFILACFSYLGLNFVLAYRLKYLMSRIGYGIKFREVFISHVGGMIAGDITPGRSGYFLTPAILKKRVGASITDGMACIFSPQGIEFILKVGGAIAAVIYIATVSDIGENVLLSVGIGAAFLLIVGIIMLMISWHEEHLTSNLLGKFPFLKKFNENLSFFKERSIQIKHSIRVILILYFIGWSFAALHWFYLGKALGIDLPLFVFFLLHPLITILMFVPVSPAGLGLMEGGVILAFSFFGITREIGMAFSVLVRVSMLLVDLMGLKVVLSSIN